MHDRDGCRNYKHLRSHLKGHPFVCKCYETLEKIDGETTIRFHCVLPPPAPAASDNCLKEESFTTRTTLSFDCQAPSCGALKLNSDDDSVFDRNNESDEINVVDEWNALEDYETVDPHLFEAGYTLAGRTGFQVWAGARLLLEYCLAQLPQQRDDDDVSSNDPRRRPRRIVELGAGVGLVGTAVASHCAHVQVLLTDLPTLVEHSLVPNLWRNHQELHRRRGTAVTVHHPSSSNSPPPPPPQWLLQAAASASSPVVSFGSSWVGTASLDWTQPVTEQLSSSFLSLDDDVEAVPAGTEVVPDLILASDCVWLISMLDSLLDTADALMAGTHTQLWLSLQKREKVEEDSSTSLPSSGRMFTTIESILQAITDRSWQWTCVAWRPIRLVGGQESEAFVFEVSKNCIISIDTKNDK
jgi:predicted nicotinamide N-methyase